MFFILFIPDVTSDKNTTISFFLVVNELFMSFKINDEFIVTLKLDGVRVVILKENGIIQMFSRQGKPFEDFNELLEEIKLLNSIKLAALEAHAE